MQSKAKDIETYLKEVPSERQEAFSKLRDTILENLPQGFEECMSYGMIGYVVPKRTYPNGYHVNPDLPLPFLNIASQKNFIAFYHSGIYAIPELYDWFVKEYPKHSKYKLDMGKSCVRFKRMDAIPYELLAELLQKITIKKWVQTYESFLIKKS